MKNINLIDGILAVVGAILVYGAKNILKITKQEVNDKKVLILKAVGLVIAGIGLFRIMYS